MVLRDSWPVCGLKMTIALLMVKTNCAEYFCVILIVIHEPDDLVAEELAVVLTFEEGLGGLHPVGPHVL
jgi:hypothetical protein